LPLVRKTIVPLIAFVGLVLIVDLFHEVGHALWGTAMGGRVLRMQIAYFEVYPELKITPNFVLGAIWIEGLDGFSLGLFKLGGSMTTNIISWFLTLILQKMQLGSKTRIGLRIMWFLGLLDLPFYVIFPQIGLHHWIFWGGEQPEPLIGARLMGVSDSIFYIMVILSTVGLSLGYIKYLIEQRKNINAQIMSMNMFKKLFLATSVQ